MPVITYQNLPFASRNRSWDGDAARKRIAKWAGGPDKENVDFQKYRKAFLWYDSDAPEEFGSFKMPIADVIDGELKAVLSGVRAAAAVLKGSRGGADIPSADVPKARSHLDKYYSKARTEFDDDSITAPWAASSDKSSDESKNALPRSLADATDKHLRVEIPAYELEVHERDERLNDSDNDNGDGGEHRADADSSDTVTFSGYAMRWGEEARIGFLFFSFTEKFRKGAFKKTISERGPASAGGNKQIKFLRGHDMRAAISAKLTTLKEDATGLYFEAETINTSIGRDLAEELRAGVIDTVSIGFSVVREELDQDEDPPLRTVLEARLYEISAVNWPAFAGATIDSTRGLREAGALSPEGLTELMSFAESLEREISAAMKEGEGLSAANLAKLTQASECIQRVVDAAEPDDGRLDDGSRANDHSSDDSGDDLETDLALRERLLSL